MIDYKIGDKIQNESNINTKAQNTIDYKNQIDTNVFQSMFYRLNREQQERANVQKRQFKVTNFLLTIIALCCFINTAILLYVCKIIYDVFMDLNNILKY